MAATYVMLSADMVDTLIREHYLHFLDTYTAVRYPVVMRADMGRVAILHRMGGPYADLDVFPNKPEYKQGQFSYLYPGTN